MSLTHAVRIKMTFALPWVTKAKQERCQALKWNQVPLKALFHDDPKVRAEHQAKHRCKNRAVFHYRFLKGSFSFEGDAGDFCFSHLQSYVYGMQLERPRMEKWWDRHHTVEELTRAE